MATYAIGDIQGCCDELHELLERIGFDPAKDRLWLVGDLVNRGPQSLETLRFVRELGDRAVTVLGNHDLHLIAHFEGFQKRREGDTFERLLAAPDARELVDWLRARPLLHREADHVLVHAGLLPQWTLDQARVFAGEVEAALTGPAYREFLANLYGSKPERWDDALAGWDRLRVIVNAMTRMRYVTPDGRMEFHAKGEQAPRGFLPWYEARAAGPEVIVFGHWSARGLVDEPHAVGLDTGCVWGGALSALRLEDRALFQLPCRGHRKPGGEG